MSATIDAILSDPLLSAAILLLVVNPFVMFFAFWKAWTLREIEDRDRWAGLDDEEPARPEPVPTLRPAQSHLQEMPGQPQTGAVPTMESMARLGRPAGESTPSDEWDPLSDLPEPAAVATSPAEAPWEKTVVIASPAPELVSPGPLFEQPTSAPVDETPAAPVATQPATPPSADELRDALRALDDRLTVLEQSQDVRFTALAQNVRDLAVAVQELVRAQRGSLVGEKRP